ncbi:MAG: DUF4136 domain-containing protein [Bacteroidetes bacterium]|nr:DUF4136 domain-containing protein [Bacteroidota bacterium]
MKNILSIFVLVLFLSSCSSLKVYTDSDKTVDFNQFASFSLYPWDYKHGYQLNDYDKGTILNAIKTEMTEKGYEFEKEGGDLVISIFLTLDDKTSYTAYTDHYGGWAGYGGGWGYSGFGYGYGYGPGFSTTTVTENNYQEGTLIIDIFNAADKKLIWQGIGLKEVQTDLDKRDQQLPKNVGKILASFPTIKKN